MMTFKQLILITFISSIMTACTDSADESASEAKTKGDHIWKSQTDTLKAAKDVAGKLQLNLEQQQEKLEDNQ